MATDPEVRALRRTIDTLLRQLQQAKTLDDVKEAARRAKLAGR